MTRRWNRLAIAIMISSIQSVSSRSEAGDVRPNAAAASAYLDAGTLLWNDGKKDEACQLYKLSLEADRQPSNLIAVGACEAKHHKPLTAWYLYREAYTLAKDDADRATEDSARARFADDRDEAGKRADALWATIPGVCLELPETPTATVVRIDGANVARRDLSGKYPLAPGPHTIVVSAPGQLDFSKSVVIVNDGSCLRVPVSPLTRLPVESPPPTKRSPLAIAGFTLGGTGVVTLGVSGVLAVIARNGIDEYERSCYEPPGVCTDLKQHAKLFRDAATVALFVGTGLTLLGGLLTAKAYTRAAPAPPAPGIALTPTVSSTQAGMVMTCTF